MQGRILLLVVALSVISCASSKPGVPPAGAAPMGGPSTPESRRQAAKELTTLMGMPRLLDSSIDTMLNAQLSANPKLEPFRGVMRDFFARYMSWASLENDFVTLYAETFSEQELRDMIAFYTTPTGQKALKALPELMQKGAALGQAHVQEHVGELEQLVTKRAAELQGDKP